MGRTLLTCILILGTIVAGLLWTLPYNDPQAFTHIHLPQLFQVAPKPPHNQTWNSELVFRHKVWRRNATNHNRNDNDNDNDNDDNKKNLIFVVGLPKAGTSSLFAYFHCLGFYSQHWFCCGSQHDAQQEGDAYLSDCMVSNLQEGLPILDGCGDYDVYTEMNGPRKRTKADQDFVAADGVMGYRPRIFLPQHYHLEELHAYAPHATWILNVRPVDAWVESVSQVPAKMLTKQLLYEAQSHDPERWAEPNLWSLQPYRPTRKFLEEFWEEHIQRVTDFVAAHPSHALIWVNITNPHAGMQLARDLKQVGNIRFPKRLLQGRGRSKRGNTNTDSENDNKVLYSRARACWGAHNVKQHG